MTKVEAGLPDFKVNRFLKEADTMGATCGCCVGEI